MTATQNRLELVFEDEDVDQVQVRITNAGDGLSEAMKISPKTFHIDDDFACVLRGKVTQVNHKKTGKDGEEIIVRVHTVKATAITEVEIEMAKKILAANAESLARQKAAIDGQLELDQSGYLEGQQAVAELHEGNGLSPEFTNPAE